MSSPVKRSGLTLRGVSALKGCVHTWRGCSHFTGNRRSSEQTTQRVCIAASLVEWLEDQGVKVVFIAKASPWQNGINERFNGTMERELFGHEVYHSILEIQYVVDAWTEKYNTMRVHRALAGQTPAAYAKMLQQAGPADQGGGSK